MLQFFFSKYTFFSNDFLNCYDKKFNYRGIRQKQNDKWALALEIESTARRKQLTITMEKIINLAI